MENRVYISIPLDSLIVSGIISGSIIKITAADGLIILERCKDEVCDCDCICDECREKHEFEELQFHMKSVSKSDSDATMCCHLQSLMTIR